jgi:alpha-L-glutamate ligase-like protein
MIGQMRALARQMLGLNRRNTDLIARYNPRHQFQVVDNKIKTKAALTGLHIPVVETFMVYRLQRDIARFAEQSRTWDEFVIKPAQGAGGEGVVIIAGKSNGGFVAADDRWMSARDLESHLSDILGGVFSLNQRYDEVLIERRVHAHPALAPLSFRGLPDIRILVFRGVPIMAMVRVATHSSRGRANLHLGGIGVGIDLPTGVTTHALAGRQWVTHHPDTGVALTGHPIPDWNELLTIAARCAEAVALGYIGVDLTLDARRGACVLELNARPGLLIQLVNRRGLRPLIAAVEQQPPDALSVGERVRFRQQQYARHAG